MKTSQLSLFIMSAALLTACSSKSQKDTTQEPPLIDVATVITDSVTVYKSYPAYLTAGRHVDIVARVNGYITAKPFVNGGDVKAGQLLYSIESTQYADAVAQAKAQLDNAESSYDYNSRNYNAMKKAYESEAVSRMEVLQSKNLMETSQASIKNAKALLNSANTNLGYCSVRAPFSGKIADGNYQVGAYVSGGASPVILASLYDNSQVNVNFSIDDKELISIINSNSTSQKLDMAHIPVVFGDTLPESFTADISYLAPVLSTSTGTLQVQATVDNPQGILRAGMYATVKLPSGFMPNAMLIDDASIATDQQGKYVYLVNPDNTVVYTPVKTGELVGTKRIILSGVKPGDRYVSKALLKVRDGMKVRTNQ